MLLHSSLGERARLPKKRKKETEGGWKEGRKERKKEGRREGRRE